VNTLVYLVYGSRRDYQLELTYSVLSAVHWARRSGRELRIALVSDAAQRRSDLPVETLTFSPAEFAEWTDGGRYRHAAKAYALLRALDEYQGKVALLDTDTFFKTDPGLLFEQVAPGRSVMHNYERPLGEDRYLNPILQRLRGVHTSYPITASTRLFNSGVIGLDYADRALAEDALALMRELYARYPAFNIEQFAFSIVLDRGSQLTDCTTLVRHYFGHGRGFIHERIAELFPQFSTERFEALVAAPPPSLGEFPKKRPLDQLRARLIALLRRQGADYRFAYLASLSALSCAKRSPGRADIWARVAVDLLRQNEFPIAAIEHDFRAMRSLNERAWSSEDTRRTWGAYWQALGEAQRRGQLRATNLSLIVPAPDSKTVA
jgi:hypothetical protein